jgi:hypothetical protein
VRGFGSGGCDPDGICARWNCNDGRIAIARSESLTADVSAASILRPQARSYASRNSIANITSARDMLGQRNIKPEQLPAEEDIKKLERRVKSDEKKLEKQSGKLPKKNSEE